LATAKLRTAFIEDLRRIGLAPCDSHANFVLLPFASAEQAASARIFLKDRGILIRPMTAYGLDQCLRITLGTPDEMRAVIDTFRQWKTA
jgi:histidinol-phosphate aminotransferase